jgi:hypothetical protein
MPIFAFLGRVRYPSFELCFIRRLEIKGFIIWTRIGPALPLRCGVLPERLLL